MLISRQGPESVTQSNGSVAREVGFTQHVADLLLRKTFAFDLKQTKRDMR